MTHTITHHYTQGVKQASFSPDGRRFVTSGYDKVVRIWDTETGKVLSSHGEGKMFYCVRFHPEEETTLMAGCGDKKIYQWDLTSGETGQIYDYHLGRVVVRCCVCVCVV